MCTIRTGQAETVCTLTYQVRIYVQIFTDMYYMHNGVRILYV